MFATSLNPPLLRSEDTKGAPQRAKQSPVHCLQGIDVLFLVDVPLLAIIAVRT